MQDADAKNDISGETVENNPRIANVEQVVSEFADDSIDSIAYFFAVGLIVNILLIVAYFIWAYRQWNKKSSEDNN